MRLQYASLESASCTVRDSTALRGRSSVSCTKVIERRKCRKHLYAFYAIALHPIKVTQSLEWRICSSTGRLHCEIHTSNPQVSRLTDHIELFTIVALYLTDQIAHFRPPKWTDKISLTICMLSMNEHNIFVHSLVHWENKAIGIEQEKSNANAVLSHESASV